MTATKQYLAPRTLEQAARLLAPGRAAALAGGTDLLPRWSKGLAPRTELVVDLKRIEALTGVSPADGEVRLGPCTPLSRIASDPTVRAAAPILAEAAGRIACPQIRNRATIGGNLCNASPAADTAVPLILLDAVLDLASASDEGMTTREIPITDFFRGPGVTALAPGEILACIRFRPLPAGTFAAWDKFGTRPAMEIAVASVGLAIKIESGKIAYARVAYGSVAPVPLRGHAAEDALLGCPFSAELIARAEAAARREITPLTDLRASQAYRREVVGVMLRRMLQRARRA